MLNVIRTSKYARKILKEYSRKISVKFYADDEITPKNTANP